MRQALESTGALANVHDDRWLGSVFNEFFEPTGEEFHVEDKERNIHKGRATKVWRLKEEYRNMELPPLEALPPVTTEVRRGRFDQLLIDVMKAVNGERVNIVLTASLEHGEVDPLVTITWRSANEDGVLSPEKFVTDKTLERALLGVLEREKADAQV